MQYDEFIGQVQQRARLSSRAEAERAAAATLQTLGRRLAGGAADNLAAELPPGIGHHLRAVDGPAGGAETLDDFWRQVSRREGVDLPEAVHHARAVVDVLGRAVSGGAVEHVRAQLPGGFDPLFESGSEGELTSRT